MRILIDTNIIIYREDHKNLDQQLSKLMSIFNKLKYEIFIHPLSVEEIENDKDKKRKSIIQSKVSAYSLIEEPPNFKQDDYFQGIVGEKNNAHDYIDNNLLYCVYKKAADFLITEDNGILKKADKLPSSYYGVFNIDEAIVFFNKFIAVDQIESPPSFEHVFCRTLNVKDAIFDTLKDDYDGFEKWWDEKCIQKNRKAWINRKDNEVKAILILKAEDEKDFSKCQPAIKTSKALKICLFKVSSDVRGYRIGECFIKMAIDYCIKNNLIAMYLTHFREKNDALIPLIEKFGFYKYGIKKDGEEVFFKEIIPSSNFIQSSSSEVNRKYYPSFYHGENTRKFIIPMKPLYHERLFPEYYPDKVRQKKFFRPPLSSEGNSIIKSYLCHRNLKSINKGDILLFYQSHELRAITTLGVVENYYSNQTDPQEILKSVSKITVYSPNEIKAMTKKKTAVILFWHHFYFNNYIESRDLIKKGLLKGVPQAIMSLSHEKYLEILKLGGMDERFAID